MARDIGALQESGLDIGALQAGAAPDVAGHIEWYMPLDTPRDPSRVLITADIPFSGFQSVYFAPEVPHPAAFDPQNYPPQAQLHELRGQLGISGAAQQYSFYAGGYTGEEITTMDKWYQPFPIPGQPKKISTAELPYSAFVQFDTPVFPVPSMDTWFLGWENPFPKSQAHSSEFPFTAHVYLPPVDGCIELEIDEFLIPRAVAQPNMPILYITSWQRWNAHVPVCRTTQQSPGTQPQNN